MVARRDFGPIAGQMRDALDTYSRDELADLLTHIVRVYVIEGKELSAPDPRLASTSSSGSLDQLSRLSFPQLILHLQMNLPHPELQGFRVNGDQVWASRDGNDLLVAGTIPVADEMPPDWDDIAASSGPPRFGPPAATGAARPDYQDMAPAPGTPAPRQPAREASPASVAQDAARVQRPSVGLRNQPAAAAAPPARPPIDDWFSDPPAAASSAPSPAAPPPATHARPPLPIIEPKKSKKKDEDIGDRSDRFSMLELD